MTQNDECFNSCIEELDQEVTIPIRHYETATECVFDVSLPLLGRLRWFRREEHGESGLVFSQIIQNFDN